MLRNKTISASEKDESRETTQASKMQYEFCNIPSWFSHFKAIQQLEMYEMDLTALQEIRLTERPTLSMATYNGGTENGKDEIIY